MKGKAQYQEITFKPDKKHRDKYFSAGSFAHPAKMMLPLQRWLIERYSKPGEVILDPMAGQGTLLIACTTGRHVITVELEAKFVQMQRDNWTKIQTLGPEMGYEMGTAVILQGDAIQLEGLLVDSIISSPPYAESNVTGQPNSYPGSHGPHSQVQLSDYRQSKGNLGNLPYGSIDAVISSPPYQQSATGEDRAPFWEKLSRDPTSARFGRKSHPHTAQGYQVDAVISSPPYEDSLSEPEDRKHSIDQTKWGDGRKIAPPHSQVHLTYPSSSPNNIGNLKSDSYLQAMLLVYQNCFAILKDGGLLILVTKNFIREKQEIRLDLDTIKLCEQAGFQFVERHYRKLTSQSFWRTIYQQKYPDAPVLDKEDILVFRS